MTKTDQEDRTVLGAQHAPQTKDRELAAQELAAAREIVKKNLDMLRSLFETALNATMSLPYELQSAEIDLMDGGDALTCAGTASASEDVAEGEPAAINFIITAKNPLQDDKGPFVIAGVRSLANMMVMVSKVVLERDGQGKMATKRCIHRHSEVTLYIGGSMQVVHRLSGNSRRDTTEPKPGVTERAGRGIAFLTSRLKRPRIKIGLVRPAGLLPKAAEKAPKADTSTMVLTPDLQVGKTDPAPTVEAVDETTLPPAAVAAKVPPFVANPNPKFA